MRVFKNLLATLLIIGLSGPALAQWTTTGQFTSINSGNGDGVYPASINTLGDARFSIGANWTGGATDLSLINSNIANTSGGGFSFWQMMSANSKKMLAYMKGDGSVGFGGIIPTRALEVRGVNPIFRIGNFTGQNTQVNTVIGGIEFPTSGENVWMAKINANVGAFSDQPYLTFHTGSTSAEQVRIAQSGNVGIGSTDPVSKLHIKGGGLTLGSNLFSTNTDGYLSLGDLNTSSTPNGPNWPTQTSLLLNALDYSTIGFHDSGNRADFIRVGNGKIDLGYDGGWGRANIGFANGVWTSAGNVGIGTASPTARLEVAGEIKSTAGRFSSLYSTNSDGLYPANYANTLGDAQLTIGANWTGGATDLSLINSNIANTSGGGFSFWQMTGASSKRMLAYIRGDGSMGIGTTTPGAYKLAVEGKIGAREVEVKTGSWADFVFDKEYALPSLEEVEEHIKEKQHLPGIPSEAEVKEKGYGLGEMDAKLLQKIEELTLYVIQQQKEINQLKKLIKPRKSASY